MKPDGPTGYASRLSATSRAREQQELRARRVKTKSNPLKKDITLSQALQLYPLAFSPTKISAAERSICEIDTLPERYRNVEALYLSGNNIRDMAGIVLFQRVTQLGLAHNLMEDMDQIDYLSTLRRLTNLSLIGNPLA
ncbi:hypothetical protein KIPB_005268, partial [Kipferlia bialata]|eukprot:g5268.t1